MSDQLFVQLQGETIRMLVLDMSLLSIGRTPDNGLSLPDRTVATRHAEIRLLEGRFVLTDLGNGDTFIAGRKVTPFQPQELSEGTLIQIGPYVLAYLPNRVEETPPEIPAPEPAPLEFVQHPLAPARDKFPLRGVKRSGSIYMNYLPTLFTESDFLNRYLLIFETIWEPLQQRQDFLHMYFNAGTAPDSMLAWLARWLDMEFDPYWPEQRKRLWLKEAMELVRWRGTRYGLQRAIELGSGVTPHFETDPARPYFLRVLLADPDTLNAEGVTRESVLRLIERNMPAHVLYEVKFVPLEPEQKPARKKRATQEEAGQSEPAENDT